MPRSTLAFIAVILIMGAAASGFAKDAVAPKAKGAVTQPAPATAVPPATQAGATPAANTASTPAPAAAGAQDMATTAAPAPSMDSEHPQEIVWPFDGMTGHVDRAAAQRGFQVYKQVCSACHSMNLVAYRSLGKIGFTEAEIKALAAEKQVPDFDDKGQPVQRAAKPSDNLVPPYLNEAASRAANGGAYPPDLSLIIKAREGGGNYVYSLLTGFRPAPATETPVTGKYYNPYFPGHWVSMPPPLSDNVVSYQDGTPATVDQMARDVVVYLQWAAEPEMEQRNQMGLKVLVFLVVMAVFFYVAKKRIWRKIGH